MDKSNIDKHFVNPITKQFEFDEKVVRVFDDMVGRSVPYYDDNIKLICAILDKFLDKNSKVLELGCSTASTLLALYEANPNYQLFGIDNSSAMIEKAKQKSDDVGAKLNLVCGDLLEADFGKNDSIICTYTMQFIRPLQRTKLVQKIYDSLNEGGVFLLSEKLIYTDSVVAKNTIDIYEDYKQSKGYSRFEIASKRQALENVLIPFSEEENKTMLKNAGFSVVECMFKWVNFATFLAIKKA